MRVDYFFFVFFAAGIIQAISDATTGIIKSHVPRLNIKLSVERLFAWLFVSVAINALTIAKIEITSRHIDKILLTFVKFLTFTLSSSSTKVTMYARASTASTTIKIDVRTIQNVDRVEPRSSNASIRLV